MEKSIIWNPCTLFFKKVNIYFWQMNSWDSKWKHDISNSNCLPGLCFLTKVFFGKFTLLTCNSKLYGVLECYLGIIKDHHYIPVLQLPSTIWAKNSLYQSPNIKSKILLNHRFIDWFMWFIKIIKAITKETKVFVFIDNLNWYY